MWAITDFTEENGATRLIPGSHLRDQPPNPLEHYDTIPAEMSQGQRAGLGREPLARRRREPHRHATGGHRHELLRRLHPPTGEPAAGNPARSWSRPFPRRLQELVGYSVYNGLIGHIDKQHPAKVVLAEDEGVDMVWDLLKA